MHKPIPFVWSVIKPYKYLYLVMMLAPVANGVYPIMYNYAVKLLIDLFTQSEHITLGQSWKPIAVFVGAQVILDGAWRAHNFAQLKCMPYILQNMLDKICKHCFNLPYIYFQNNLSGSIVGKIKGIGDNYVNIHQAFEHQLTKPLYTTLFSGTILAFTNLKIFCFVLAFTATYLPLALYFFTRLAQIEQLRQDSWYHLFGSVADRVANIFTILSFATKKRELRKIQDYYNTTLTPITIRFFRYDLIILVKSQLVILLLLCRLLFYFPKIPGTQQWRLRIF